MAYKKHIRIVAKFELGSASDPVETASCTLNFNPGANFWEIVGAPTGELEDAAEAGWNAWAAYVGASAGKFLDCVRLVGVSAYCIGTDGRMMWDPKHHAGTPVAGPYSTNAHPWQCSTVLTLVGESRGAGRFGRIYLPPQGIAIDRMTGMISTSDQEAVLAGAKVFVEDISDYPLLDYGWNLCVASSKGEGVNNKVTHIRLGRVIDTQRRRRRDVPEQSTGLDVST